MLKHKITKYLIKAKQLDKQKLKLKIKIFNL